MHPYCDTKLGIRALDRETQLIWMNKKAKQRHTYGVLYETTDNTRFLASGRAKHEENFPGSYKHCIFYLFIICSCIFSMISG